MVDSKFLLHSDRIVGNMYTLRCILIIFLLLSTGVATAQTNKCDTSIVEKISLDKDRNIIAQANDIVEFREKNVEWWMWALGIMITVTSVIVPIIASIIGYNIYKTNKEKLKDLECDFNDKKGIFDKEFELQKQQVDNSLKDFMKDADLIMKALSQQLEKSKRITADIDYIENSKTDTESKEKAITKAKDIIKDVDASDYQIAIAKAYELYYSDHYKEAIEFYEKLIENFKKELTVKQLSNIYFKMGYSYCELKDYENSIKNYNESINLISNNFASYANLGATYLDKYKNSKDIDDLKEAEKLINRAIILCGNDNYQCWIQFYKAEIEAYFQNYTEAINTYKELIFHRNEDNDRLNMIECMIYNNNIQEARQEISKYKSEKPLYNDFDLLFLESIISIIESPHESTAKDIFTKLHQTAGVSFDSADWDLIEFNNWIISPKSAFVSEESKDVLTNLLDDLKGWASKNDSEE